MTQDRIRLEFNRWADLGHGRGIEKRHWETTRQLIELMDVGEHDNVVDLGCGVGWATRVLAQKASRGMVLGIDLSDGMIANARSAYRNPHNALFAVADAAGVPCPDALFNVLLSVESVYFCADLNAVFREVHRTLRPSGRAFFLLSYYTENAHGHGWAKHIEIAVQLLGTDDYVTALKKAGFHTATHRRLVDSTPLSDDWTPTHWFPTPEDHMRFRSEGALLL